MSDQNEFTEKFKSNLAAGMMIENLRLSGRAYVLVLVISELDEDGWSDRIEFLDAFDTVSEANDQMTKAALLAYQLDIQALPHWIPEGEKRGWHGCGKSARALPIVYDSSFRIGDGTHWNSRGRWFSVLDIRGISNPAEAIAAHFENRWAVEEYFAQLIEGVADTASRFAPPA